MHYRKLGRTGLAVSPVCLGTMGFGPPAPQSAIDALIGSALDLGINLIDTANCYDGPSRGEIIHGHAESMLGEALRGRRDEFVVVTKAAVPLRPGQQHRGLSPTHLLRELEASLRRLKTDWVDVFMIHWPDAFADTEEVLHAIDAAVRQGKARYFGISNHQAWQVGEYLWEADKRNWIKPGVSEIPLSLLDRRYENDLPFYSRHNIGITAYQPLKGGILSEKHLKEAPVAAEAGQPAIGGWNHAVTPAVRAQLTQLKALADETGLTLSQYAIAWVLAQPAVSSVIVGARDARQLADVLHAADVAIPAEHVPRLDAIAPGPEKPKPRFER